MVFCYSKGTHAIFVRGKNCTRKHYIKNSRNATHNTQKYMYLYFLQWLREISSNEGYLNGQILRYFTCNTVPVLTLYKVHHIGYIYIITLPDPSLLSYFFSFTAMSLVFLVTWLRIKLLDMSTTERTVYLSSP